MAQTMLNLKKRMATDADLSREIQVASADGAITIKSSTVLITKAGVCAMTLAAPAAADDGVRIVFITTTAQAHTLTVPSAIGVNGGTTGTDVGTWTAAIGNNIVLVAYNGNWYTEGTPKGVTLG